MPSPKVHPEQRDGEVFAGDRLPSEIETIRWRTKRVGEVSRTLTGAVLTARKPVFVKAEEVELFIADTVDKPLGRNILLDWLDRGGPQGHGLDDLTF